MTLVLLALAAAVAQLAVGNVRIEPADILDGRAIAGAAGEPIVMLTLSPAALRRLKASGPTAAALIDGKPVKALRGETTIEIAGVADFDAAAALAKRLSGKPPLPDSLDQ